MTFAPDPDVLYHKRGRNRSVITSSVRGEGGEVKLPGGEVKLPEME